MAVNEEMINNENNLPSDSGEGNNEGAEFDPVSAINELKANSVPKSEYNKLKAEKDKYLKALIKGDQVAAVTKKEPVDLKAERARLSKNPNPHNLQWWKDNLALRQATIEQEGWDSFAQFNKRTPPTKANVEQAEEVASFIQQIIDDSQDNPDAFQLLYKQRVYNDPLSDLGND